MIQLSINEKAESVRFTLPKAKDQPSRSVLVKKANASYVYRYLKPLAIHKANGDSVYQDFKKWYAEHHDKYTLIKSGQYYYVTMRK
jgi:hypothetical protein